jgi:hypothetical protein
MDKQSAQEPSTSVAADADSARAGVSRRHVMTAMAAIVASSTAAPAFAGVKPAADRREWVQALRHYEMAREKAERIGSDFDGIYSRYHEAIEKVPHVTVDFDMADKPITTSDAYMLADAKRQVRGVMYLENHPGNYQSHRWAQRLLDAQQEREAAMNRIDERMGYSIAAQRCDDAWDAESEAKTRVMQMPAPDRAAVLWKLEELFGAKQLEDEDGGIPPWSVDYTAQFFDDVRRFLSN